MLAFRRMLGHPSAGADALPSQPVLRGSGGSGFRVNGLGFTKPLNPLSLLNPINPTSRKSPLNPLNPISPINPTLGFKVRV